MERFFLLTRALIFQGVSALYLWKDFSVYSFKWCPSGSVSDRPGDSFLNDGKFFPAHQSPLYSKRFQNSICGMIFRFAISVFRHLLHLRHLRMTLNATAAIYGKKMPLSMIPYRSGSLEAFSVESFFGFDDHRQQEESFSTYMTCLSQLMPALEWKDFSRV